MARDLNHVGIGFRHTGSDGADTDFSHQLHADRRRGMDLVEIVDQLSEIFDRIDVMVRRR